jgi:crossover junction endodeoxyribonuclease RuvC
MFILGVDPGLSRCGWAVAAFKKNLPTLASAELLDCGVIKTPTDWPVNKRLVMLKSALEGLITSYTLDAVVVERVFFQSNAKTAMSVGQASGIALLVATERQLAVYQYSANEVKLAVAGYGSAQKSQVQKMVAKLFGLSVPPTPADVADALGLAYCHFRKQKYLKEIC